jgi:hypothetical protein
MIFRELKFLQTFTDNYPGSKTFVVSPDNVEDFLLMPPNSKTNMGQ